MKVGELFQTLKARTQGRRLQYDVRVLAIIYVNPSGEAVQMDYMSTQQHDVTDSISRTIIVTEQLNPEMEHRRLVEAFCWEPRAELREDFIIRMGNEHPVLYSPPDVELLVHAAIYGAKPLPPGAPARRTPDFVFLSSEAYQVVDRKSKRADVGRVLGKVPSGATTTLTYDSVRLMEVPGIKGIKVWGGYEESNEP
jgi:hypothetical protein